jgi:hypothetical protein
MTLIKALDLTIKRQKRHTEEQNANKSDESEHKQI